MGMVEELWIIRLHYKTRMEASHTKIKVGREEEGEEEGISKHGNPLFPQLTYSPSFKNTLPSSRSVGLSVGVSGRKRRPRRFFLERDRVSDEFPTLAGRFLES